MQQRDQYKHITDFLADESFRNWVRTREDHDQWEIWTVEHPGRARLVTEARLWLLAMHVPENKNPAADSQNDLIATWRKIKQVESDSNATVVPRWNRILWRGVAASLVLVLLLGWLYQLPNSTTSTLTYTELTKQHTDGLIEQVNNSRKPQLITLSDGSSVLLQPRSKLSYPSVFAPGKREVYLSGEGFFEISKNPKQPFFVFANEVVTRVVGTSFRIKAYTDQPNVEVVVRTGRVNVSSNQLLTTLAKKEVVLLPNQGVRFLRHTHSFETIVDPIQPQQPTTSLTAIEQVSFDFTDVAVAQILKTIEQAYLVEIDFPDGKVKNCFLTTSLTDEPLPEKLKIICESISENTRYEMNGNHIKILTDGCN